MALDEASRPFFDAGAALGADLAGKIDEANKRLSKTQLILNDVGRNLTDGLVRGLTEAVTATDNLGQAFQDLATDIFGAIGQALILSPIQTGISGLAGDDGRGLFSILNQSLGKRERGGLVDADRPYIVGEKGPELFIPNQSGEVLSNEDSRAFAEAANTLIQPGTSSGEPAAFSEEADVAFATGRAALRGNSERVEQRESQSFFTETMMAESSRPMEVKFNGPRLTFNEQDYVPAGAVPKIVNSAVKQSKAEIFADLKNRPSARRSLGM